MPAEMESPTIVMRSPGGLFRSGSLRNGYSIAHMQTIRATSAIADPTRNLAAYVEFPAKYQRPKKRKNTITPAHGNGVADITIRISPSQASTLRMRRTETASPRKPVRTAISNNAVPEYKDSPDAK